MSGLVLTNFARATVASPPSGTGGLSFTVAAGKGALFPNPGVGEYFYGAFTNAAKSAYEIVKVTARSGDSFTIDPAGRGYDNSAPATWSANDVFFLPWTNAMLTDVPFSVAIKALAALSGSLATDTLAYFTSATAAAITAITATGRSIIALSAGAAGQVIQYTQAGVIAWVNGGFSTGDYKHTLKSAETGWILGAGGTIGDASSAATVRANADCQDLFVFLWNNLADAQAPVVGGRGGSALTDWNAHKKITVPDLRGLVLAGKDDMGGTPAGKLTNAISNLPGNTLGAVGGDQRQQSHLHTGTTDDNDLDHTHQVTRTLVPAGGSLSGGGTGIDGTNTSSGESNKHKHPFTTALTGAGNSQNVQPTGICNILIKL